MDTATINEISGHIVDAGMKVHSVLGPGLLESVYEACLEYELKKRGFHVQRQLPQWIEYEELRVERAFRMDLVVNDLVVVEVKAVSKITATDEATLLTYLVLSDHRLGLLMNFHEAHLRNGIKRKVNGM